MISFSKRTWKYMLLIGAIVSLTSVLMHTVLTGYQQNEVLKMTEQFRDMRTKTMCVGRFLVDVPASAQISYRQAFVAGWEISTVEDESEQAFWERVSARETELKASKNEKDQPGLEGVTRIDAAHANGKIFVFGREWTYGIEQGRRVDHTFVSIDAYVRTPGRSFDISAPIRSEQDVKKLAELIAKIRPREETESPQLPGFCFDRGFIGEPLAANDNERVTMFVGLSGHPDVAIALSTMAGLKAGLSLLERDHGNEIKRKNPLAFQSLRKGERTIGGIEGHEILDAVVEPNGSRRQNFMWESLSRQDQVLLPNIVLEMSTGHSNPGSSVNSSLANAEALALWEKISSSVRLRATGVEAAVTVKPAEPIGTRSMAGEICTQGGWWQCTDGGNGVGVLGGTVQLFTKGQAVPQAVLLPPPTLWQRFKREQPTFQSKIPSSWKLLDRRKNLRSEPSKLLAQAGPRQPGLSDKTVKGAGDGSAASVPVGAELASGDACTASGWWHCAEPVALDGTRWFAAGEILPSATKSAALTALEKLKGVPPFVRVHANWQLVRFSQTETSAARPDGTVSAGQSSVIHSKDHGEGDQNA